MKYSPGFDEPSNRPKVLKSRSFSVTALVLGAGLLGVLGVTFLAYLSPSLMVQLSSVMLLCAQAVGLR